MPRFQQVQIGFEPGTIEELDSLVNDGEFSSRAAAVREFCRRELEDAG